MNEDPNIDQLIEAWHESERVFSNAEARMKELRKAHISNEQRLAEGLALKWWGIKVGQVVSYTKLIGFRPKVKRTNHRVLVKRMAVLGNLDGVLLVGPAVPASGNINYGHRSNSPDVRLYAQDIGRDPTSTISYNELFVGAADFEGKDETVT